MDFLSLALVSFWVTFLPLPRVPAPAPLSFSFLLFCLLVSRMVTQVSHLRPNIPSVRRILQGTSQRGLCIPTAEELFYLRGERSNFGSGDGGKRGEEGVCGEVGRGVGV